MRPPLQTAEIHAWNWGQRAGKAACDYGCLLAFDVDGHAPSLSPDQVRALARLGRDRFLHWAIRGYGSTR